MYSHTNYNVKLIDRFNYETYKIYKYRSLRSQNRIKLHIQLFLSLTLYSLVVIVWECVVVYDQLSDHHSPDGTLIHRNTV